jgi:uncharacterized protein YbjT (DUF2867 family)
MWSDDSGIGMKIIITGANSAVGRAILRHGSCAAGGKIEFVAAVRSQKAAEEIRSQFGDRTEVVRIAYSDPASLDTAFKGACAVIHLAGILVERHDSTYEQANVESTRSVVEAAKRNDLKKFVLVSATGADERSGNRYYRTKGQAEALVRASGLRYTIIRVSILLGSGTAGAATLERQIASGKARLINSGRTLQQPLCVEDLARSAVVVATQVSVAENATLSLVGPNALSEREIVQRAASASGRQVQISSMPKAFLSLVLAIRERVAGAGFSRDALEVVTADSHLDPQPAARELGIQLTGIDEMIRASLPQGSAHE